MNTRYSSDLKFQIKNFLGMHCPYCGHGESVVSETRDSVDLNTIRRRRTCLLCTKRFTTYERVESVYLTVIKKSGRREQFTREKLKIGLLKSCEKTKVTSDQIEKIATEIERELRSADSVEVSSVRIGELVAQKLKEIDKIAYIRFASVFRHFVDLEDFEKEVKELAISEGKVLSKQIVKTI